MSERVVKANGIKIWTEDFGRRTDAPLLLIMGASAQGIQWPESFIERLTAAGRYVIRYDNRDTGQSTCFDFEKKPYTLNDLALDALGVLDAYELQNAHVAGASMGGMIVQTLMIQNPKRLRSATIIMSSPLGGGGSGEPTLASDDLPGPDPKWMAELLAMTSGPLDTRQQMIDMRVALFTKLAGRLAVDPAAIRDVATREVGRATNFMAQNNHSLAIGASTPRDRRPFLKKTKIPTLVIHGTDDPILPYPHGKAIADAIPKSRLITIDGMGHDLPEATWRQIVEAMVAL